jgi:hypothetical protein
MIQGGALRLGAEGDYQLVADCMLQIVAVAAYRRRGEIIAPQTTDKICKPAVRRFPLCWGVVRNVIPRVRPRFVA